jgi:serine/threonine-protein kinase
VARLFNEARAATAVRSPGIVEVFDFGFLDDRSAYIVMEYLEGESLALRIRRGRQAVAATLTVLRGIARALQAAHDQGIIHRDLKPDNVFLVPDADLPSGERVKLLDFGIAKLATEDGPANHTRTGTVLGTPSYMAPEQCRGSGQIDHRVDLYALGCVGYEMLCGQPPFVAEGSADLMARHLYFAAEPPRSHRPGLPVEVDDFVMRLLHKDPAARPGSAIDVIRAIDRLAALPSVAGHGDDLPAAATSARPPMDTTLSGAASTSELDRAGVQPRRTQRRALRIIAGMSAFAAVISAAVIWLRANGGGAPVAALHTVEASAGSAAEIRPAPPPSDPTAPRASTSTITVTPILPDRGPSPAPEPDLSRATKPAATKVATKPARPIHPRESAPAHKDVKPPDAVAAPPLTREQLSNKFKQVRRDYDLYKARFGLALEKEWGELAFFIQYMGTSADATDYAEAARRLDAFRAHMAER